ncbi:hypothetical protein T01_7894 [Trichinella spiralis]|uniref:Uncharacterized protein n=1 Tax=Trichinella spiralis TaxID=6334 RepID=A0A0V1ANE4_TRISP|nr:hypothetical protein T01_7894 [Trichinella spiralis]
MAQRNHRTEHNVKRELRSLVCHGYFYISVAVCRLTFRPTFARLTPAVIYKRDSSNETGYEKSALVRRSAAHITVIHYTQYYCIFC